MSHSAMRAVHPIGWGTRRRADLDAVADQAHAEGRVVADAHLGHVQVALLEDLERQQPAGKQHGAQRKDGDLGHAV